MEAVILNDIRFEVDEAGILEKLHLPCTGEFAETVSRMLADAHEIARPKAIYKESYIDEVGEETIVIDSITFTSRILRVNFDGVHRVFPYVATCGREMMEWAAAITDPFENYTAAQIMEAALHNATAAMEKAVVVDFSPGKTSTMNPGSIEDWPIDQQRQLMALLGDPLGAIGVELTESCLMLPIKSVSGIAFPTESGWQNCQLCRRENCPERSAPYDAQLHGEKLGNV